MLKKSLLILALLFLPLSVSAARPVVSSYEIGGYIVSVEDTGGNLRVSVRNTAPYGYILQSSSSGKKTIDGKRVKTINVTFDVAPELDLRKPVKASDTYSTKFSKGTVIQQVLITINSGGVIAARDMQIWDRPKDQ